MVEQYQALAEQLATKTTSISRTYNESEVSQHQIDTRSLALSLVVLEPT